MPFGTGLNTIGTSAELKDETAHGLVEVNLDVLLTRLYGERTGRVGDGVEVGVRVAVEQRFHGIRFVPCTVRRELVGRGDQLVIALGRGSQHATLGNELGQLGSSGALVGVGLAVVALIYHSIAREHGILVRADLLEVGRTLHVTAIQAIAELASADNTFVRLIVARSYRCAGSEAVAPPADSAGGQCGIHRIAAYERAAGSLTGDTVHLQVGRGQFNLAHDIYILDSR